MSLTGGWNRSSQALVAAFFLSPQVIISLSWTNNSSLTYAQLHFHTLWNKYHLQMKTSHQVGAPCKLLKLRLWSWIVDHEPWLFCYRISNFSLLTSVPNLKRIRLEQVSIPSFAFTNMKFKNLQKLSLFTCNIVQAFSTSTIQVSDALPKLEEINIDYSNDLIELPAEIFHLIKLKKISITNCHKLIALPREIGKLVNLEILRLCSCIELLELPHTNIGGVH